MHQLLDFQRFAKHHASAWFSTVLSMLKGGGWGGRGLVMMHVFEIVKQPKNHRKATEKKTEKPWKPTLSMFFFIFCFLFFGFSVVEKCIEMSGVLPAKIVPGGGGGSGGGSG